MLPRVQDRPPPRLPSKAAQPVGAETLDTRHDRLQSEVMLLKAQLAKKEWELHDTWRQITIQEIKRY